MTAAPKVTEAAFLRQIRDLARMFRWSTFHPFLSRWSEKGFPDVVLCRPPRLILAELKTDRGKTTPDQERWLGLLGACPGVETYLWRPADLDEIAELLR
jgi:hypothetical protein